MEHGQLSEAISYPRYKYTYISHVYKSREAEYMLRM